MGFLNEHGLETLWAKIKSIVPTKTSDLINDGDGGSPADPFVQESDLATVAKTGSYNDLEDTPDIPANTSDLTNDGSDGTSTYVETDELEDVAFSGDYEDLNNKPEIPAAQVAADWDKDGDDYVDGVKNRTHYTETTYVEEYNETVESISNVSHIVLSTDILANSKEQYYIKYDKIVVNDKEYIYTGQGGSMGDHGVSYTAEDSSSIILWDYNDESCYADASNADIEIGDDFVISCVNETENVVQLNEKYIPSTIARTSQIPSVDQHYNSSSANAQSGTAVAEAIAPIQEVIPVTATSSNQLVDTNTLVDAIQQQVTEYIAPDASMIVPFEHATYMGGANNLEDGPWYKDGLKCGEEGSPIVYVTENDYAVVLQDESVCYFEAHGFRYQRHKDGGATDYGYAVLPDANHTHAEIHQVTSGTYQGALYFEDDSLTFSEDPIFYIVTDLSVLTDSVVETDSLDGSPIATYDLNFPTTRYVCTTSQTDSTPPVWSFNYTVNDTALTGNQIQALNSGINSTLVNKLVNLSYDDLQNKPTVKIGSDAAETLGSIEVTKTEVTANNDRYWNLTITANGNKTLTTVVPEVDQNFNKPASRAAISTAAVNGALAGKIDASDFATFKKTVILKDGYIEPANGSGSQTQLTVVTTENNVNLWAAVQSQTKYAINQDPNTKSNFWAAVDIHNIDEVYVSGSFEKVRYCLTDGAGTQSITFNSAQDVIDFIDSKTTTVGANTTHTVLTCSYAEKLDSTKSWNRKKIENTSNNKLLIMYFGNALSSLEVTAASLEPAFLDTIDQTSVNAVQSNVLYTEFAKYTKTADLPAVPSKTSDLTNDGEGGSPASRFIEEWEIDPSSADLDYIMGENQ